MLIRPVQPEDNEQLINLEKTAGQGEKLRIVTERSNYFFRARKFNQPIFYLAEDEKTGKILGVMGVGPATVSLAGKKRKGGFIFDWRSSPEIKSLNRSMYRIWMAVIREIKERGIEFVFGFVKEDNYRSLNVIKKAGAFPVGNKIFHVLPLHRPYAHRSGSFFLDKNIDPWEEYLTSRSQWGEYDLFPLYDAPEDFPTERNNCMVGKIHAGSSTAKIWNTTREYNFRVLEIPRVLQLARPVFSRLSRFLPLPRIPGRGTVIKNWFLYDFSVAREKDLPLLLECARQEAIKENIDYLVFFRDAQDAPLIFLQKKAWIKFKYNTIFLPFKELPRPQNPTYYDTGFL